MLLAGSLFNSPVAQDYKGVGSRGPGVRSESMLQFFFSLLLQLLPLQLFQVRMKMVELGRKTSQPFSTSTFGYENENEYGKSGHEHEHELTECRKWTNSSELMSNMVGI
jgi:hypothetical protein